MLFENLDFDVRDGELLVLSGKSGSGKTTLLYCLCGIIPRNIKGSLSGVINIDGKPVAGMSCAELPRAVAMVFQEPGSRIFLPALEDEIAFTLENLCIPREEMRERVAHSLELAGLADKRYENPAKLSGGQVKLAALTAVLAFPPRVLLLDELIAGLDDAAAERAVNCVNGLRKQGCAVILCEHNAGIWGEYNELRI
jgi:energy-coupling factor transporter ATP-binding protein EcfA2